MNGNTPNQKPDIEQRIAELTARLRETEKELQSLTGKKSIAVELLQSKEQQRESEAAREKLEWSASLQRIAGKAARLGGWAIELPEYKLTWSDETCDIHDQPAGYQPAYGEGVSMFPPEYREEVARKVKACAEEGIPYDFELPKITAKGRRIWVRSMGEAVRDASGKIIRLQGAFQDITERKQAELNLFKSNRALRLLRACSEALTLVADEKQLLAEVCRLAVEVGEYRMAWVGYAQDDESHLILPMAHAGAEQGYLSKMEFTWSENNLFGRGPAGEAIRSGQSVVCEDITKHPAANDYLNELQTRGYRGVICLPLRDENRAFGLLTLYSAQVLQPGDDELKLLHELADDLAFGIKSLRARAESRIAGQKIAQQAALLDKARDAIFVRDLENRVMFWNKGAERVYGWSAADVLGRSTAEFLSRDQRTVAPAFQALLQKGEWAGEFRKQTKAGHAITVDCRWTLVRDEHQQPHSVLCIETDITEKKQLEANFLRAQRMESIGTLAGGIAHDLNNVFAPILMSITLLKMNLHDEESKDVLQTLQSSAQRGAELVKQVLSFARGVEGERIEINPLHLLRELGIVVRDTFPKSIVFDLRDKLDLRTVTGDPTQLHQVFLNLCVNARDAMPDGGILTVKLQNALLDAKAAAMNPDAHPGAYVAVQVSDSGSGIALEIRDRIFEPFFTTKEFGKGTGLGLSTSLAIVKSHGGFINVDSEPTKGTTFTVYLPANTSKAQPEKVVEDSPQLPAGNGELILVVDDEKSIRHIAQHTLERVGYRVLLAAEGAEALALYAQHSEEIAVVLTDMAMPVMDGPSLIVALRALNPQVQIIGSSGLTSAEALAKSVGKRIRHFLSKPYTAELLLKTLDELLNGQPANNK
jgi:PAS domain S-box-containing protein